MLAMSSPDGRAVTDRVGDDVGAKVSWLNCSTLLPRVTFFEEGVGMRLLLKDDGPLASITLLLVPGRGSGDPNDRELY